MNKEQKEILFDILELIVDRQERTNKQIAILQNEIKLLNKKINYYKNKQCKGCCKCSK